MRITITAATQDELAETVSDIAQVMESYFVDYQGMSKEEAEGYYRVSVEDFDGRDNPSDKLITVEAEMTYEEFQTVERRLNSIVDKLDPTSYFEAETSGRFVAVVDMNYEPEQEDDVVNYTNVESAVNKVLRQVSSSLNEDFKVTDLFISTPKEDGRQTYRIYIDAESDSYETMAYTDVNKDEVLSVAQMKADMSDDLYGKLINNVVPKKD